MVECCRVYNRESNSLTVQIEPWGTCFELPSKTYLSVFSDKFPSLIELDREHNGTISVYLNDAEFDDLTSSVCVLPDD